MEDNESTSDATGEGTTTPTTYSYPCKVEAWAWFLNSAVYVTFDGTPYTFFGQGEGGLFVWHHTDPGTAVLNASLESLVGIRSRIDYHFGQGGGFEIDLDDDTTGKITGSWGGSGINGWGSGVFSTSDESAKELEAFVRESDAAQAKGSPSP